MGSIDIAFQIALNNLRSLYGEDGIFAGARHFKDYWGRDSFFASFGCLEIEDSYIVKKNLSLHLNCLNKRGQLPLRIGATPKGVVLAYFGIKPKKRTPIYHTDKNLFSPVDQNSLFVIAFFQYIKKTKDTDFLKANLDKIERIVSWNFHNCHDGVLMEEDEYCNWADSIKKKGKVLYTNVCYCHSLKCMSELYKIIGNKQMYNEYLEKHQRVKNKINELFWSGEHYLDWIDKDKQHNYFSTDGNLLAVLWDIADIVRAKHIEEASHIFEVNEVPSECVHPLYPKKLISSQVKLIGLEDYHNGVSWLWLGCINALAKDKLGMKKEALSLLERISSIIIESNGVYEIYEETGEPVNRFIYKAEFPFAWSAGLFVYAVKKICSDKSNT
jgi:glycogen debranching enzyme